MSDDPNRLRLLLDGAPDRYLEFERLENGGLRVAFMKKAGPGVLPRGGLEPLELFEDLQAVDLPKIRGLMLVEFLAQVGFVDRTVYRGLRRLQDAIGVYGMEPAENRARVLNAHTLTAAEAEDLLERISRTPLELFNKIVAIAEGTAPTPEPVFGLTRTQADALVNLHPGDDLLAALADFARGGGDPILCDGCNVREPFEHRCHSPDGRGPIVVAGETMDCSCECKPCLEARNYAKSLASGGPGEPLPTTSREPETR